MTQWTHTIGRMVTNAVPTWAQAVVANDTLYAVGKAWNDATDGLNSKLVFPEPLQGDGLYSGTDGTFSPFHDSYGGAVYVKELGAHGTFVFGSTGEGVLMEQLSSWSPSDDNPAWNVFQQPGYVISAGAAATAGATWYFDQNYYDNTLPADKKIPWSAGTGNSGGTFGTTWDRTFPIGMAGFIITGKNGPSYLGGNRPHNFRYNSQLYIPASMTGTGAGAIVVNGRAWTGPFSSLGNTPPANVNPDEWFTSVHSSGRAKYYLYAMNVTTKQWSVVATLPDFVDSYTGNIAMPYAFVDTEAKRVYYTANYTGHSSLYWADFSAGAGAVTVGGPVNMTELDGQADASQSHSNADLFIGTTGALAGKKLYYYRNGFGTLGMIDVGANTIYRLNVIGLPAAGGWHFTVDQANARVGISIRDASANTMTFYWFNIPSDPTSAANYTLHTKSIAMNGITLESVAINAGYGNRHSLITSLGGIVLTNQRFGKMLAFRPSWT